MNGIEIKSFFFKLHSEFDALSLSVKETIEKETGLKVTTKKVALRDPLWVIKGKKKQALLRLYISGGIILSLFNDVSIKYPTDPEESNKAEGYDLRKDDEFDQFIQRLKEGLA